MSTIVRYRGSTPNLKRGKKSVSKTTCSVKEEVNENLPGEWRVSRKQVIKSQWIYIYICISIKTIMYQIIVKMLCLWFNLFFKTYKRSKTFFEHRRVRTKSETISVPFIIYINFKNIIHIAFYIVKTRKYHIRCHTGVDPSMPTIGDVSWRHP